MGFLYLCWRVFVVLGAVAVDLLLVGVAAFLFWRIWAWHEGRTSRTVAADPRKARTVLLNLYRAQADRYRLASRTIPPEAFIPESILNGSYDETSHLMSNEEISERYGFLIKGSQI